MRKETLLAAVTLLAFTAPAAATCLDQIGQLEQRLAQIETETADVQQQPVAGAEQQPAADETVEVEMEGGEEVEVTAAQPGTEDQPQDTWLGGTSPASVQGAREQLDGARGMAEAGDEAACLEQVAQAERIIAGLEEQ
jgi:hypothetical protein